MVSLKFKIKFVRKKKRRKKERNGQYAINQLNLISIGCLISIN